MAQKDIKPKKVFWMVFCGSLIAICVIMIIIPGSNKISKIFSADGAIAIGGFVFMAVMVGIFMAAVAEESQKKKKKEHVDELMRQYLEKKLREEENRK